MPWFLLYVLIHEMIFLFFMLLTDWTNGSLSSTVINSTVIVPTPTRSPSMPSTTSHNTTTSELAGTIVPFLILCLAVLVILCFIYYRYKHKSGRRISSSQTRAVSPQEMGELYKMTNNASLDSQQRTTVRQNLGKFYS